MKFIKLKPEEIESVADQLDEIIGNNFFHVIVNVVNQRKSIDGEWDVQDEDIYKIKQELKRYL